MKQKNDSIRVRVFPSVFSKLIFGLIAIPIFTLVSVLVLLNMLIAGIIILVLFGIGSIIFFIWKIKLRRKTQYLNKKFTNY